METEELEGADWGWVKVGSHEARNMDDSSMPDMLGKFPPLSLVLSVVTEINEILGQNVSRVQDN
jgi:hypothetical protein